MRTYLFIGVAAAALLSPVAAMAQSTGSTDTDAATDIVVTGARSANTGGVVVPNSSKTKGVLTQEFISKQTPGQSVDEIINQLPGVSFQNNDPFGSAGGTLNIRGFDASRISQTVDGIPLNDTGNYAIYSNQQVDPELIDQVNVNYGSTDVDSPTASASGSTVNYRTLTPTDQFGVRVVGSVGDFNFFRVFGVVNTGVFTSFGTKAWFAASHANNNVVFNDFGKIDKQQYNAKIYQPIGSNGDFISVMGNYNQNQNNFFGSVPLRQDQYIYSQALVNGNPTLVAGAARTAGTASTNRFPNGSDELPYHVARCQVQVATAGTDNVPNTCGTSYDERYNPSKTGNIRINSKFSLTDKLTLFVDPSFQYTKANGGGTVRVQEGGYTKAATATTPAITTPLYGFIGGNYYAGKDVNADGDVLDKTTGAVAGGVTYLAPSETETHRYGLITSLRYDFSDDQTIRVGYSHDYGRHRQTGELAPLQANGVPFSLYPIDNPLVAANGRLIQKRDRLSFAILDLGFGQYTGKFLDEKLVIDLGVTAKFFKRNLNNFCFTTSSTGNVDCLGRGNTADNAIYAAANPTYSVPQSRQITYNRVLPSGGFTYHLVDAVSVYASYSKGIQVPGTDNLYNAFFYGPDSTQAHPTPETTDNFDAGIRYNSGRIQAALSPWYTRFTNRLASAYDQDTQATIYRNLGRVDKYGIDASLAIRPVDHLLVYTFGSYLKSQIKNDVQIGTCTTVTTVNCATVGQAIYAATAGKRESGAPVFTFGGRIQADVGPVELGANMKATGRRYNNDQNFVTVQCTVALVNTVCPTTTATNAAYTGVKGVQYTVYGASAPAYATVDFDARIALDWIGLNKTTYLQLNLQNAFNQFYVGGYSGGTTVNTTIPFAQIGSPRAFIASLNVQF